ATSLAREPVGEPRAPANVARAAGPARQPRTRGARSPSAAALRRPGTPHGLGQSDAYPRAPPAPPSPRLDPTAPHVGPPDERRHHTAVGAAGDKTWTLNKKPGTLPQLAVTDAAQRPHSFLEALDRFSSTVRNRLELV